MTGKKIDDKVMVLSFTTYRKAIGWLGVLLPFVLVAGTMILGRCKEIQPSISHYYYTIMGDVFSGTLCCLGFFLITYKYKAIDNIVSTAAGILAICVAIFPTTTDLYCDCVFRTLEDIPLYKLRVAFHYISAATFLVLLALMSIFLFTRSDKSKEDRGKQKRRRNTVYRVCGCLILFFIGAIAIINIFPTLDKSLEQYHYTFWGECGALWSFGVSWLIKGEFLLKD